MSTFDDLPNEIIICLFEYLKVEDKFHSFFDCNQRLRQLVKRYSIYSRHGLTGDIKRFSTLHSWYKHLNYVDDGNIFYMIPMAGEQARYGFGPCISDYRGIHWHFFTNNPEIIADPRIGEIVSKYPVKLNPCFYPESSNLCRNTSGFKDFTYRHYPAQFGILSKEYFSEFDSQSMGRLYSRKDTIMAQLEFISTNEQKRLKTTIIKSADCIWKDLQNLEDVNILTIKYHE
ncbi:unnamed protein product [Rotaria socialis]|uniref:F-box domain-containing protein n=1 Tax=Rotaria socialis TaxID=392032 RepID=A0A818SJ00_9BILA|nr:unnamed protein product [Rotaria socialis]CAF3284134.1 unnamed protein product [Rotaria socialis]CAF3472295.1 unnamed protein product [Rotaria socialis]CAF3673544.1 unnamed protein product [Rotaria socialis]CAF4516047.1 unnamed protein product [Rotaria socialis]